MDRYLLLTACLALLTGLSSCTIKEARGECPCYLQVSFTDPEATGPVQLLGWREAPLFRERVRIEDCRPAWTKAVDKGILTLSACKGIDQASTEGRTLYIPVGCQADSLYAYAAEVDATGDVARAQVSLRKQFATILLDIRKPAEEVGACRFTVEGTTAGVDLLDYYSPVVGLFRYEPQPRPGESIVSFRVPRQGDDALLVTIRPADGAPARFPLGEYIRRLGYNWKSEELQDIYVAIDLVRGKIGIRTEDWEKGAEFPLIEI